MIDSIIQKQQIGSEVAFVHSSFFLQFITEYDCKSYRTILWKLSF